MKPVRLDPHSPFKRDPLPPHEMRDRLTNAHEVIVLCHLGIPRIERDQWLLTIDGMVERPRALRFEDLLRYPKTEVTSFHQCCGNPLKPFEPTRRICNVRWGGVRLADVLADCRPGSAAQYIWTQGADYGEFSGVAVEVFVKDLPIERVEADVLIAYELNGSPLPAENGFPARLVVPGFYGTNSVKWLTRMTLTDSRAQGAFTTRWYNDPILDGAGRATGQTTPVWSIAPDSLIVSPAPQETIDLAVEREIWGWAWADGGFATSMSVSTTRRHGALPELEPPRGREWQRFSISWTPRQPGVVVLSSVAEAMGGQLQPIAGRRNAIYEVPVNIT